MIHYVTTCNKKLYEFSGQKLLLSFIEHKIPGRLYIYSEDKLEEFNQPNIFYRDIRSEFYNNFFLLNKDVIPDYAGGTAVACKCNADPLKFNKERQHKKGCYYNYWNRNLYRWFNKIAALAKHPKEKQIIVWLDIDCQFIGHLPEEYVATSLGMRQICWFKSKGRPYPDTGIVIYGELQIIDALVYRYESGMFRQDIRWDDCYQLNAVIHTMDYLVVDLAEGLVTTRPIEESKCGRKYITHFKGLHGNAGLVK